MGKERRVKALVFIKSLSYASTAKFSKILEDNAKTYQTNSGIFLDSLREILANQSAQKSDMEPFASSLFEKLSGRFVAFVVFQIILIIGHAAAIRFL